MKISVKLVNLEKPTIIFPKNEKLKLGEEYFFEFEDLDYKLDTNKKTIKRRLEKFDKMAGFNLGVKIKGLLKLDYNKNYNIKIENVFNK